MDREYKITAIGSVFPSKFPDSKKYNFTLDDYPNEVSAFSKFPMTVGQTIFGHVEVNGQWHNFKWGKKEEKAPQDFSPSLPEIKNILEFKIIPLIQQTNEIVKAIAEQKGVDIKIILKGKDYPEMTEENSANVF